MNRQFGEMPSFIPSESDTPPKSDVQLPPRRINENGFGLSPDTDGVIEPTSDMEVGNMLQEYYLALQALPQEARVLPESTGREMAMQYAELLFESSELDVDATTKENLVDTAARMLQSDKLSGSESDIQARIQTTWDRIINNTGLKKAA